jgi:hypothetical protein
MDDILTELRSDHTIALLGRRGSGKSTALKQIMYTMQHEFPLVIVMTGTRDSRFFDDFVAPSCIFDGYHERVLEQLIQRNRRIIRENASLPKTEQADPRALVVLDDCISEKEAGHSHALHKIFTTGRHLGPIAVIMTTQHVTARCYPPILRNNTDIVFVAAQSSEEAISVIAGQWLGGIGPTKDAEASMHAITRSSPYTFFCIHARKAAFAKTLRDYTCSFKADLDVPKFRMGARRYWEGSGAMSAPPPRTLFQRIKSMLGWQQDVTDEDGRK